MAIAGHGEAAREIASALGLNPSDVTRTDIRIDPDEIVIATVQLAVTENAAGDLATILRKYQLVEKEQG
jgi:hypothetical protein